MDSSLKIIQTLYLPGDGTDPLNNTLGFLSPEFNWMGWELSCLQLKQYYKRVELYTNNAGYEVLINKLKLPYDDVHVVLNGLSFPSQLWAYPKLHTYSLQTEPFLHVDGDAFFWEKLDDEVLNKPLIAQNIEINAPFYKTILTRLLGLDIALPEVVMERFNSNTGIAAYNAGIIGGTDIDFFKNYTAEVFRFINVNCNKPGLLMIPEVNMIYEQVLFYCLAKQRNAGVTCYLKDKVHDMTYPGFADFMNVAGSTKYIHLMGAFKKNADCCYMLAKRLRHDYPEHYYRVIDECKRSGIEMLLSCYNGTLNNNEVNWKGLYDNEKKQYALIDDLFKNNMLLHGKFKINKLLRINNIDAGNVIYSVPLSYRMEFKQIEADQLDEILIDLMSGERSYSELLDLIADCFDDGDTEQGREDIGKLLSLKLRTGLYANLYEVCE